MPKVSTESDNVGQVLTWNKDVGDDINAKDTLCDVCNIDKTKTTVATYLFYFIFVFVFVLTNNRFKLEI